MTSSNDLFSLTNCPKLKDIQFIVIENSENEQILTFERDIGNVFVLTSHVKNEQIIKSYGDSFSVN